MVERGGEPRLAQEPLAEPLVRRQLRLEQLQGYLAVESLVRGEVHHSHAASPEQLLQTEAGDLAPGEWILPDRQTRSFPAPSKENTTVTEALRLGDYSLELELGRGAVGVVHRGRSADGRVVAIKTFDRALADDETFRARLAHEARVAREIVDPHLVRILEAGEDDGRPYLVLEYLPGGSLAARLVDGPLRLEEMLRVVAEVAAGLDALHRAGIVHRDVKPSNVLLREDGSAALTDFGVAKGAAYTVLTRPGEVLGTLDYLAPELDPRWGGDAGDADIYALGCVAFECLAGRPPFADRSLFGVGTAHLEDHPPDPPASPEVDLGAAARAPEGSGREAGDGDDVRAPPPHRRAPVTVGMSSVDGAARADTADGWKLGAHRACVDSTQALRRARGLRRRITGCRATGGSSPSESASSR